MPAKSRNTINAIRRYAVYIVFATNIIALLLLFSAFLSWNVSPAKASFFAYTGLAFPFTVIVNIGYVILWFIVSKWKLALVGLVSLVFCWNPIYTYFPVNKRSKEVPADCIKLLTYNVHGFFDESRNKKSGENNRIVDYINKSNADIVCLQEFTYNGVPGKKMNKDMKAKFPAYPYYSVVNLRPYLSGITYGVACFSKYPILQTIKAPYNADGNGSALVRLDIKGRKTTLVVNHLQSNKLTSEDKKLYKEFIKDTKAEILDSVANNITSRLGVAYKERSRQVDIVSNMIKNENATTLIVCGDFNDPPISYSYKKLKGDLTDSFRETGLGMGISYNENLFWFRIDYIFHSKNIKSYNSTIDKVKYSDHYPLWTYLQFTE